MKKILYILLINSAIYANTIKEVDFKGLEHLSKEQAKKISNLEIGESLDIYKINKAIKRLYSYGYFDKIDAFVDDGKLTFDVKEKQFIMKVNIKGASTNDKKQILTFLGLKKGDAYSEKKISDIKEKISSFYQSKGFYDSVIEVDKEEIKDNAVIVNFNINRGELVTIKKVNLIGAKNLGYSDFDPVISNKQKELLGWFPGFNDGKLRILSLMEDAGKIKNEYLKKGYLDANVLDGFLDANMQNYTANLTYYINEGDRYKIGNISIDNPISDELKINLKELKSKAGKYINIDKVRFDTEFIKNKFQDLGYALAEVYPDITKNIEKKEVLINFKIKLNDKYKIGNVIIRGNDKTVDKVIRREMLITEGMLYNQTNIEESKIALRKTGYFESVEITPTPSFTKDIDLLVDVKERQTGAIAGGLGYSTEDGLIVNFSASERNIFGSGLNTGISIDKSNKRLTGRIFLNNPRIFDSNYSFGSSIYSYKRDWDTYEEYSKGLELSLGRKIANYWHIGAIYNIEHSDLRKATNEMLASGYKLEKTIKSAITPYVQYDSTDDFYLPRNGIYSRVAFTYVGLGGDQKYKKASFDFKYYKGLKEDYDIDMIFRFKTSFNKLFDYDETPINSRLYLGGMSSIRGYESDSINPRGSGPYKGVIYNFDKGGGISLNSTAEINFPLINKLKLRGSIFYDYGMIGEKNLSEIKRQSAGISLDWNTPMGLVAFVFSKPLNKKEGDKTEVFSFSIGSQF